MLVDVEDNMIKIWNMIKKLLNIKEKESLFYSVYYLKDDRRFI